MVAMKIFATAGPSDWHRRAVVGRPSGGERAYIFGYRWAADAVVDHAIDSGLADACFYPAAYLYRHGLELALKQATVLACSMINILGETGDVEASDAALAEKILGGLNSTHSLERLLNGLSDLLAVVGQTEDEWPSEIRSAITELHSFDSSGQAFRYAELTSGTSSISQPQLVDIENLKEFGEVIDFIGEGVCGWLDEAIEGACQYLQILRDDAGP